MKKLLLILTIVTSACVVKPNKFDSSGCICTEFDSQKIVCVSNGFGCSNDRFIVCKTTVCTVKTNKE